MAKYTIDIYLLDSAKDKLKKNLERDYATKITEENFIEYLTKELEEYTYDYIDDEIEVEGQSGR